jgi:hypothetical protein
MSFVDVEKLREIAEVEFSEIIFMMAAKMRC